MKDHVSIKKNQPQKYKKELSLFLHKNLTLMKNCLKIVCFFSLFIATVACGNRRNPTQNQDGNTPDVDGAYVETQFPIEIDVQKNYDKRTIILQDVAEVTYIPFETNKDFLLEDIMTKLSVSDSFIVSYDRLNNFYVIDKDGSMVSKFNRMGRGPQEYPSGSNYHTVDFDRKEIYIYPQQLNYKIWCYSMEGQFRYQIHVPSQSPPLWLRDVVNYDKENLLVYAVLPPSQMGDSFSPYYLVSKQTGEFKPLPIKVSEIKEGKMIINPNTPERRLRGYNTSPIIRNGDEFFISDFASDTIYSFKGGKLSPFIVNKPSLQGAGQNVFVGLFLKTTRYSFLSVIKINEDTMEFTRKFIGIDHKSGEIFEASFWNNDFTPGGSGEVLPENYFKILPAEYAAIPISATRLTDNRDAGKLTGPLVEIAATMKYDDNPVLMLVKFNK